jgi:Na+-driven multidrug efflux pump
MKWGVEGIWVGLTSAIMIIGAALVLVWARRTGVGQRAG